MCIRDRDTAAPHFQNARYTFSYNAWSRSEGLGSPSGPKEKSPSSVFAARPPHEPSVFPIAVICVQSHPLRNSPSRHLSRPLNDEEHFLAAHRGRPCRLSAFRQTLFCLIDCWGGRLSASLQLCWNSFEARVFCPKSLLKRLKQAKALFAARTIIFCLVAALG